MLPSLFGLPSCHIVEVGGAGCSVYWEVQFAGWTELGWSVRWYATTCLPPMQKNSQ
jgi:hypothetical protein